jgi:hypothetical protein
MLLPYRALSRAVHFRVTMPCQAPPLAQGGIILGPVRDLVLLLGNVVAAVLVELEGHGGCRVTEGVVPLRQPSPHANRPIRATNSPRSLFRSGLGPSYAR